MTTRVSSVYAVAFSFVGFAIVHSLTATRWFKNLVRRPSLIGERTYRGWYRLAYSIVTILTLLPLVYCFVALDDVTLYAVPSPWSWVLFAVQALGCLGVAVSILQSGAAAFVGMAQVVDYYKTTNNNDNTDGVPAGTSMARKKPPEKSDLQTLSQPKKKDDGDRDQDADEDDDDSGTPTRTPTYQQEHIPSPTSSRTTRSGLGETLIIRGLYRWVRHPLYTSSIMILWAHPSMTRNFLVLAILGSLYMILGSYVEERRLEGDFGAVSYQQYRQQVPARFVPYVW